MQRSRSSPQYAPIQGSPAVQQTGDKEDDEFAHIRYCPDIYHSVMVAAFGGVTRCRGRIRTPVHPFFCFALCIPLFLLQCILITFLQLDLDASTPVIRDEASSPAVLLAGKVLLTGALQLILFDGLYRSLASLFLLMNPITWTDIRRLEIPTSIIFTRPSFLATFATAALLCKTIIALWVTFASLSVVLVCEEVTSCIMHCLVVLFIAELDINWWSVCAAVYGFDDMEGFFFELYCPDRRSRERSESVFARFLSTDLSAAFYSKIGSVFSHTIVGSVFLWQSSVVVLAIDSNILPLARDICAMWHLLDGHSEYCLSPTLVQGCVNAASRAMGLDFSKMLTRTADPKFSGYCTDKYEVMQLRDIMHLVKKYHWLPIAIGALSLLVFVLPNCWRYPLQSMPIETQSRESMVCEIKQEVDGAVVEELDHQAVGDKHGALLLQTVEGLERRITERLQNVEEDVNAFKGEQSRFRDKGEKEILAVKDEIANLQFKFQEEGERGLKFQSELEEFQTNFLDTFQHDVQDLKERLKAVEQHAKGLELKVNSSCDGAQFSRDTDAGKRETRLSDASLRKLSVDAGVTVAQTPAEFYSYAASSACESAAKFEEAVPSRIEARSRATSSAHDSAATFEEMQTLSDDDLDTTSSASKHVAKRVELELQTHALAPRVEAKDDAKVPDIMLPPNASRHSQDLDVTISLDLQPKEVKEETKALDVTLPPSSARHGQDLNVTIPPKDLSTIKILDCADGLHHTIPPIGFATSGRPRNIEVFLSPRPGASRDMDKTLPPVGWSSTGLSGGATSCAATSEATSTLEKDHLISSQLGTFIHEMKQQMMTELRECVERAQQTPPVVTSDIGAVLQENHFLKVQLAQAKQSAIIQPIQHDEEDPVANAATVFAVPSDASSVHHFGTPFAIQNMPEDLESNMTLQEAAQFLSPRRAISMNILPGHESSTYNRQAEVQPSSVSRSALSSTVEPLNRQIGSVRVGDTVMLQPRVRSAANMPSRPASDEVFPSGQLVDVRRGPHSVPPRVNVPGRVLGPHGTEMCIGGTPAQQTQLRRHALPPSARLAAPEGRSQSIPASRRPVQLQSVPKYSGHVLPETT
jgi:hypothetical protein